MSNDPFNDYATKMQEVRASDRLLDDVMKKAAAERRAAGGAEESAYDKAFSASVRTHDKPTPRPKRPLPKIFAVAACFAVLIAGTAFASGVATWPELPFFGMSSQGSGNSFALSAYASEHPEGTAGETIVLNSPDFGWGGYSGAYYDPETQQFWKYDEWAGYKYGLNLACTGQNIESITYAIKGDHAYFETIDNEKASRPSTQEEIDSGNDSVFHYTDSVILDYNDQRSVQNDRTVSIYLGFPVPEEAADAFHRLQSGEANRHLFYEYSTAIDIKAALALASCRIELTATFTDGSTQTKSYSIEPISGFEQQMADYREACYQWAITHEPTSSDDVEALNAHQKDRPEQPSLFAISELS
ncbi:hypothetical protein [Gordonibacter massiliensis (ex Traore et al. 2017)]|uniref:hypothetical protein n=1 Tax=Gordonibacter massiliensis (ex Traore et al. 2017) TaxID=1841863 RepID=UPI001C8B861F|nr:hypothetical protein [Gordonibacter massiliensis (ex Traore et al. 2017)]MBX9032955.1 hypothetical protein [Gordonibacter massiliensis (ex Traore et al. 2017)]